MFRDDVAGNLARGRLLHSSYQMFIRSHTAPLRATRGPTIERLRVHFRPQQAHNTALYRVAPMSAAADAPLKKRLNIASSASCFPNLGV